MIKTTTPNEVILNIYRETSESSQQDFQTECLLNSVLAQEKDELEDLKQSLDALAFQPRKSSIESILTYSQTFMARG